jgi:hypothetical protein
MGRWLDKIPTYITPSKPSKPSFVGFDGVNYGKGKENFSHDEHSVLLIKFIRESCLGIPIDPQLIIDRLLSIKDTQDIIEGRGIIKELNFIIRLWVADGMPHISDKPAMSTLRTLT